MDPETRQSMEEIQEGYHSAQWQVLVRSLAQAILQLDQEAEKNKKGLGELIDDRYLKQLGLRADLERLTQQMARVLEALPLAATPLTDGPRTMSALPSIPGPVGGHCPWCGVSQATTPLPSEQSSTMVGYSDSWVCSRCGTAVQIQWQTSQKPMVNGSSGNEENVGTLGRTVPSSAVAPASDWTPLSLANTEEEKG